MKCRWNRTKLNLCGIVVAILKITANIQHCPISSKFYMWLDNDVPNWYPTLKNFYRLPFSKWPPQYLTNSTLSDFNAISYVGRLWCGRNFSMSAINSGHHYLPIYQILMISGNVEFLPLIFYTVFWQPFWKWQTSRKFWKSRIPQIFNIVRYHQNFICG
jgi:hypothetical protein